VFSGNGLSDKAFGVNFTFNDEDFCETIFDQAFGAPLGRLIL